MQSSPTIAVTVGEPAGVGPEICLHLMDPVRQAQFPARIVVLGDLPLLAERASSLI